MSVRPEELDRISPHSLEPNQFEGPWPVDHIGPKDTSERVRFTLAESAWTSPAQQRTREKDFESVCKPNGKLVADKGHMFKR
jgi:hypothetical protein